MKSRLYLLGFLLCVCVGAYLLLNTLSYLDPFGRCYIGIDEDPLRGDERSIIEAVRYLKRHDAGGYRLLCRFVDTIVEDYCSRDVGLKADGCYIQGSRIVHLVPQPEPEFDIVVRRAEALKRYASFSAEFWLQKQ